MEFCKFYTFSTLLIVSSIYANGRIQRTATEKYYRHTKTPGAETFLVPHTVNFVDDAISVSTNKYSKEQYVGFNELALLEYRLHEQINQTALLNLFQLKKIHFDDLEEYPIPSPWVKHEFMKLRDETGSFILLDNSPPELKLNKETYVSVFGFKYPQARKRWWWEKDEYDSHFLFWHCHHWMIFWDNDKPSTELLSQNDNEDSGEAVLFYLYYNYRELYLYKYCIWLLSKEKRFKFLKLPIKSESTTTNSTLHKLHKWEHGKITN